MAGLDVKASTKPDETREFPKGRLGVSQFGKTSIGRATFEPGWRWSECVGPIEGTKSCQHAHTGYCISGRMHIRMDDGTEGEFAAGDMFTIDPGHDAWVVGSEPCVALDFTGYDTYAQPRAMKAAGKPMAEARH